MPEWFRVYRMLKLHLGWTVKDYWDAPGEYCDWALEFQRVEQQVQNKQTEAARKAAQRRR